MISLKKRKCRNCHALFYPDPRNIEKQDFCHKSECRKASKKVSQRKWLKKSDNNDYFRGPENVLRVQLWRAKHPGYWRRKKFGPVALQDHLIGQVFEITDNRSKFENLALQDLLIAQPFVLLGLIANFTGTALQDDIDTTVRRLRQLGRDIADQRINRKQGGLYGVKNPHPAPPGAPGAAPV